MQYSKFKIVSLPQDEKSCLTIKRMQIVEIRTVAKSLPPLR